MPTNIKPYNEEGQRHGYWETYYTNGQVDYKGEYINGKRHGYWESYCEGGELWFKGTYDMGKHVGYWEFTYKKNCFYVN